jgi:hypothetical protein
MNIIKFRLAKPTAGNNPAPAPLELPEFSELPYDERMLLAHKAYLDGLPKKELSILDASVVFGVNYSTL